MSRTFKTPYRKSKAVDKTCRCHGGCPYCKGNRMYQFTKEDLRTSQQLIEFYSTIAQSGRAAT